MTDAAKVDVWVCGGAADQKCPAGGEHDDKGHAVLYGANGLPCGGSVCCSKCGSSAYERDLLRLP